MNDSPLALLLEKRHRQLSARARKFVLPVLITASVLAALPGIEGGIEPAIGVFTLVIGYSLLGYFFWVSRALGSIWAELRQKRVLEELIPTSTPVSDSVDAVAWHLARLCLKFFGPFITLGSLGLLLAGEWSSMLKFLMGSVYLVATFAFMSQLPSVWGFHGPMRWSACARGFGCLSYLAIAMAGGICAGLAEISGQAAAIFLGTLALALPWVTRSLVLVGLEKQEEFERKAAPIFGGSNGAGRTYRAKRCSSPLVARLWHLNPVAARMLAPMASRSPLAVLVTLFLVVPSVLGFHGVVFFSLTAPTPEVSLVFIGIFLVALWSAAWWASAQRIAGEMSQQNLRLLKTSRLSSAEILDGWALGNSAQFLLLLTLISPSLIWVGHYFQRLELALAWLAIVAVALLGCAYDTVLETLRGNLVEGRPRISWHLVVRSLRDLCLSLVVISLAFQSVLCATFAAIVLITANVYHVRRQGLAWMRGTAHGTPFNA